LDCGLDGNQFQIENEIFTGQRMVGIQRHVIFPDVGDHRNGTFLPARVGQFEELSHLGGDIQREVHPRNIEHQRILVGSVRHVAWDGYGFFLTHFHADQGVFETGDHLMGAHQNLQRFTIPRCVELGAVFQSSGVVNLNHITLLYF